jgi:hypothetical protein
MPSTSNYVRELDDGNSQGTRLGRNSSSLISFYGATPTSRVAGGLAASTATVSSMLATSASISMSTASGAVTVWGYSSAAQANAIVTGVGQLITDVEALRQAYTQLRGATITTGLFTGS